nr:nascent polypeptide-associated complex subunit alpha, muscle-specific form-like [Gorilla gorilla gorilla]
MTGMSSSNNPKPGRGAQTASRGPGCPPGAPGRATLRKHTSRASLFLPRVTGEGDTRGRNTPKPHFKSCPTASPSKTAAPLLSPQAIRGRREKRAKGGKRTWALLRASPSPSGTWARRFLTDARFSPQIATPARLGPPSPTVPSASQGPAQASPPPALPGRSPRTARPPRGRATHIRLRPPAGPPGAARGLRRGERRKARS